MKLKDSNEAIERLKNGQEVWFYIVDVALHGNSVSLRVPPSQVGEITQTSFRHRVNHQKGNFILCDRVFLMGKKNKPIKKSYQGHKSNGWEIKEIPFFSDRESCVEAHNADLDKAIEYLNERIERTEECIVAFDMLKAE